MWYLLGNKYSVTSNFGSRKNPKNPTQDEFHPGIDLGIPLGIEVPAAEAGVIVPTFFNASGYGNYVVIAHFLPGNRTLIGYTVYGHLSEKLIRDNDIVEKGHVIGKVGSTGKSTGPHLHFEIRLPKRDRPTGLSYVNGWSKSYINYTDPAGFRGFLELLPVVTFPFQSQIDKFDSPLKHYHSNESADTGIGGYYAIGLQRNLHGGIHLYPDTKPAAPAATGAKAAKPASPRTPVRSMAPGYIVAARFPALNAETCGIELLANVHNWIGFVLVRHELQDIPANANSQPTSRFLYSLYMHLTSPNYTDIYKDEYFRDVPWMRLFFQRQYGCFVKVSASSGNKADHTYPAPGSIVWSRQAVDRQNPGVGPFKVDAPFKELKTEDGGTVHWYYKPPLADYTDLITDLEAGKTITFSEPFFTVNNGDILGFVEPVTGLTMPPPIKFTIDENGEKKPHSKTVGSGFLHWEVFSPATNSTIDWLLQAAGELDALRSHRFPTVSENTSTQENFLDPEEVVGEQGNTLLNALPDDGKTKFKSEWNNIQANRRTKLYGYAPLVIELLNDGTAFAPQTATDINSGKKFTYPVTLQFANDHLPRPSENDDLKSAGINAYEIAVQFLKNGADASAGAVTVDNTVIKLDDSNWNTTQFQFVVQVPAEADTIALTPGPGMFAFQKPDQQDASSSSADLFGKVTDYRWRNAKIDHINEWTTNGVQRLYDRLKTEKLFDESFDVSTVLPLAWWHGEVLSFMRVFGASSQTSPQGQNSQPLFQNDLAPSARLHNLHPVTALWLLTILSSGTPKKIQVKNSWSAAAFGKPNTVPLGWGWCGTKAKLGETVPVVVVDDDYSYSRDEVNVVLVNGSQRISLPPLVYESGGVAVASVIVRFWGTWNLEVNGSSRPSATIRGLASSISVPDVAFGDPGNTGPVFQPFRRSDGTFQWTIPLSSGCEIPHINGWVTINTMRNNRQWKPSAEPTAVKATSTLGKKSAIATILNRNLVVQGKLGFITGLSAAGKTQWANDKCCQLTPKISYAYLLQTISGLKVACSLIEAVALLSKNYGRALSIAELGIDGLSCRVFDQRGPNEKRDATLMQKSTTVNTGAVFQQVNTADASASGIKITITATLLKTDAECRSIINKAQLRFSVDRKYIVGTKGDCMVANNLGYSQFAMCREPYVNIFLVEAIDRLITKYPKRMSIVSIGADGISCCMSDPKALQAAVDLNLFTSVETHDDGLWLTVSPAEMNSMTLTFDPRAVLQKAVDAENAGSFMGPDDELQYRFKFVAVNGGEYLLPETGDGMETATIETAKLDQLRSSLVTYRWSEVAGKFRGNGFGKLQYSLVNLEGKTYLQIVAPLKGEPAYWRKRKVQLTVQPATGSQMKKLMKVSSDSTDARCFFLLNANFGLATLRIEAMAQNSESVPAYVSFTYDFAPKFISTAVAFEILKDGTEEYVKLRAKATGVAVPPSAAKPWGKSKAVEAGGAIKCTMTVSPDIDVLVTLKPPTKKLSSLIGFGLPSSPTGGYFDTNGVFEARVLRKHLPRQPLKVNLEFNTGNSILPTDRITGTYYDDNLPK
jgi:hypothetical protein